MQDNTECSDNFLEEICVMTVWENCTLLNTSMVYSLTESKGWKLWWQAHVARLQTASLRNKILKYFLWAAGWQSHPGYLESSAWSTQLEGKWIQLLLQIFWIILSLTMALPGWKGLSSTTLTEIICLHRQHHHHHVSSLTSGLSNCIAKGFWYVHFSRGFRDSPTAQ